MLYYSSKKDVHDICGELAPRIERSNMGGFGGGGSSVAMAKAFADKIYHGMIMLGVNWSTYAEPSLHLVIDWIDIVEKENDTT